jgi:hypothetical protein
MAFSCLGGNVTKPGVRHGYRRFTGLCYGLWVDNSVSMGNRDNAGRVSRQPESVATAPDQD